MKFPVLRAAGTAALAAVVLATLATVVSGCNPLRPHAMEERDTSSVAVAFDPSAMGESAAQMKWLQVRVYAVVNEQTGPQEGPDQKLEIHPQQAEYTIGGIKLGLKDIEISILNEANEALGTGKTRVLVKPGVNKTDTLVIKIKKVTTPVTNVPVELNVSAETEESSPSNVQKAVLAWTAQGGQTGTLELALQPAAPVVTFDGNVKAIVDASCLGQCHTTAKKKGGLILDKWPFTSTNLENETAIFNEIMTRIQDVDAPMPQAGLMEAAQIDVFKAWKTAGFQKAAAPGGNAIFKGDLGSLKVADKVTGVLTLLGVDGVELYKKDIEAYVVQQNGALRLAVTLSLAGPSVVVPVRVEPETN